MFELFALAPLDPPDLREDLLRVVQRHGILALETDEPRDQQLQLLPAGVGIRLHLG